MQRRGRDKKDADADALLAAAATTPRICTRIYIYTDSSIFFDSLSNYPSAVLED